MSLLPILMKNKDLLSMARVLGSPIIAVKLSRREVN